ncbi:FAD-dependent monooxygenase [Nakamurella deserti]|uniref:FAD-dependent monooxygenase n=1 Tax=Nakamurella deserti TaxID=2164074 RepID=UPI00197C2B07
MAGPAVSLALARAGVESVLVERRPSAPDAGSYLTVAPNGLSAMDALGVLNAVAAVGFPSRDNVMYGADGRLLGRLSLGPPVRDGLVALTLKRSQLAARLTEEARARGVDVRHGSAVAAVSDTGDDVQVVLADGTTLTGDLVIGADGVRSVVRRAIDPAAPDARYVGLTNFGGITDDAHGLEPEAWHFVFGRKAFFGAHPTPDGRAVWFVNVPEPPISPSSGTR